MHKEIFGKKYPFIMGWHTTKCGDQKCCCLAYICSGSLDLFWYSCKLEKEKDNIFRQLNEACLSDELWLFHGREIRNRANREVHTKMHVAI